MGAKVFFTPARGKARRNKFDRITGLLDKVGAAALYKERDFVAVKVHWGELGNADFIPSFFVKHIVSLLLEWKTRPFVTDSNTLYRGPRHDAVANLQTATANGFTEATLGAPVIVADGLRGLDYREIAVAGKHVQKARIASAIADAHSLLVVSHVKGHMVFGFGGALKNLGMGCAAAAAKQQLHADVRPTVNPARCLGCAACAQHCGWDAVEMVHAKNAAGRQARIDKSRCSGCGECVVVCPRGAIPVDWDGDVAACQEKTAEYAAAALAGKRAAVFVNFLTAVTPDCDCCDWSDAAIVPDIGYLASIDPVAIDKASVDLINSFEGFPDRFPVPPPPAGDRLRAVHDIDYMPLMRHAAGLGIGSLEYELVTLP